MVGKAMVKRNWFDNNFCNDIMFIRLRQTNISREWRGSCADGAIDH